MSSSAPFTYVLVPAESGKPIQELKHEEPVSLQEDTFIKAVKTYFSKTSDRVNTELLRAQMAHHANEQLKNQKGGEGNSSEAMSKHLTPEIMQGLISMTSVDIFPLLLPTPLSKFRGVSLYIDDKGISKGLGVNTRVSNFAKQLGFDNQVFHGDIFISRIIDNEAGDVWQRIPFEIKDMSSDSPWILDAMNQNQNKAGRQQVEAFRNQMGINYNKTSSQMIPGILQDYNRSSEETHNIHSDLGFEFKDSMEDFEIRFHKKEILYPKKLKVIIKKDSVHVVYNGAGESGNEEELWIDSNSWRSYGFIELDDSTWSISDKILEINLAKRDKALWKENGIIKRA